MKKKPKKRRLSFSLTPILSPTTTSTTTTAAGSSSTTPSHQHYCVHCSSSSCGDYSTSTTTTTGALVFASPSSSLPLLAAGCSPSSLFLPPRPPPPSPSQHFLKRTVSDPVPLMSDSPAFKRVRRVMQESSPAAPMPFSAVLEGYLPPSLPPTPSLELLRSTVSDPAPLLSDPTRNNASPPPKENNKRRMEEGRVEIGKLSGDWTVVLAGMGEWHA